MKVFLSAQMKRASRRIVYDMIRSEGEVARTDLTKQTRISLPTILKIANLFVEQGLLIECSAQELQLGRKPMLLRFNPDAAYSVGIEMERKNSKLAS